jgi:hypothetical protein
LQNPDVDGRIIVKWILQRLDGGMDWIDLAQDRNRWTCEYGDEPSGSIKYGEFVE